jgi:hypothetical protein
MEENQVEEKEIGLHLQDLRGQLYEWTSLIQNPGWKHLAEIAKKQADFRTGQALRSPIQITEILSREFQIGEAAGIDLFINLPETEISRLQAEIDAITSRIVTSTEEPDYDDSEILPTAP